MTAIFRLQVLTQSNSGPEYVCVCVWGEKQAVQVSDISDVQPF